MALKFPDSADSADLAAAGYSQVIILGGGTDSASTSATTDFLLIGGGGGAGGRHGGGGGAGGYKTSWAGAGSELSGGTPGTLKTALTLNSGTDYSITVGQGGRFGFDGYRSVSGVTKGNDTSISGSDITTVSVDGGGFGAGGNDENNTAADAQGGSSGGANAGGSATAHSLTDEGHAGGASGAGTAPYVGGGGGGAGGVGQTGYNAGSGTLVGGLPRTSSITGASVARAGGGGGGQYQAGGTWSGLGGGGGAGNGTYASGNGTYAGDALAHTGSGGGGGGGDYSAGGNGASGISIFRIPSTVTYSASQLASDVSSLTNCTASYLNTQVYTDDTNFGDVTLLLDGSSLSKDLSPAPLTITNSSVALSTTDPGSHPYAISFLDYGTSGNKRLSVSSPDFAFDGQFTVEGWAYIGNHKNYHVLVTTRPNNAGYATAWHLGTNASGALIVYSNTTLQQSANSAVPSGSWFHFAWTRDASNVCRLFVNGTVVDTDTITTNFTYTDVGIGNFPSSFIAGEQFYGEMADIRITPGVARYTSNFSTPTAAFPNRETSTGGDHVITFTIADATGGNISSGSGTSATNRGSSDGTAIWTPTLSTTTPAPSTTWTIPEGVDSFSIMAIGAGGAAGYSDSTSAGGGGGGGGLAYLNNIAVAQGSNEVQSITVGGGQLGLGADSNGTDGGDATDLTVTMNISTANPALNLSGYNINPYGQDSHIDSFGTILFVGANRAYDSNLFDSEPTLNLNFDDSHSSYADQFVYVQPTGSFGAGYPFSVGTDGAQTLFDIANEGTFSYIKSLAEADPNTTNRWGYNPATFNYAADPDTFLFKRADTLPHLGTDSDLYIDSDVIVTYGLSLDDQPTTVLGTIDSSSLGTGAFTLFGISSNIQSIFIGQLPGQSPYVDSNGTIIISNTGDPTDYEGYGPQDLNQILIIKNLTP